MERAGGVETSGGMGGSCTPNIVEASMVIEELRGERFKNRRPAREIAAVQLHGDGEK